MNRNTALLPILLIAASTLAQAGSADKLPSGDAALARFALDAALTAYRAAQQAAPGSYEATWKLARALADKSTLTKERAEQKKLILEAEQLARAAVRLQPADSKGHAYLAISVGKLALFEGGKRKVELSKEVKTEAEQAIALNPKEDLAYHTLAIWHREMVGLNFFLRTFAELFYGKFPPASLDTAQANLQQAVALAPTVVAHRVELGLTLIVAGKRAEAREQLDKALALPKAWVTDEYYRDLAQRNYRRTTGT